MAFDELSGRGIVRPAILLLLKQQKSHGYELLDRLAQVGLEQRDPGGVYRILRGMEEEKLVRSSWDMTGSGPARRVYRLTSRGERMLREVGDALKEQRQTLDELLRTLDDSVDQARRPRKASASR